jgi:AhpD family alkylhydroperoxidase
MSAVDSYTLLTRDISRNLTQLRTHNSDVMQGFGALSKAALAPGALDEKTKELIAMAIGVASRCDGCLGFHAMALVRLKTTPEELREMLAVAVYMGGGPSLMYAANAMAAFDEFRKPAGDSEPAPL